MIQPIADKPRNVMESIRAKLKTKGKEPIKSSSHKQTRHSCCCRTAMAADRSFKNWTVTGITLIAFALRFTGISYHFPRSSQEMMLLGSVCF